MGASSSKQTTSVKDLHKLKFTSDRVGFKRYVNKDLDSDYDDEDDSKVLEEDDVLNFDDDDQNKKDDASQMFDDLRRPEGDERQSLIEKDRDGN